MVKIRIYLTKTMNFFQQLYLTHFSTPWQHRKLYRYVLLHKPKRIVELGIQRAKRTEIMLHLAISNCLMPSEVEYCCVDPFENRTIEDGPGISFRKAYRKLSKFRTQLRCFAFSEDFGVIQIAKYVRSADLLVVASPKSEWICEQIHVFSSFLSQSTGIFVGNRESPNQPYFFDQYDQESFIEKFANRRVEDAA